MYLATKRVILRSATPDDYETLHRMELDPAIANRWRHQGRTPSPQQYVQSFWGAVLIQAVVQRRTDQESVGLVTAYDANLRSGHAYVAVLSAADAIRTGAALEGLAMLVTHLFVEWPFHKLYAETFTGAATQFTGALGRACTLEGRMKEDRMIDGQYQDRLILAFEKESWMNQFGNRVLDRLQPVVAL